jgi:hypothetical protein
VEFDLYGGESVVKTSPVANGTIYEEATPIPSPKGNFFPAKLMDELKWGWEGGCEGNH